MRPLSALRSRPVRAIVAVVAALVVVATGPLAPSPAGAAPPGGANFALAAGGVTGDSIDAVAVDAAGNTYVAGTFFANMSMGGSNLAAAGMTDVFVAKVSPSGTVLWLQKIGGTGYDRAHGVGVDGAGNVYVGGYYRSTMTVAGQTVISSGEGDGFVVRLSAAGTPQWVRTVAGPSDFVNDLVVTSDGDVTLLGSFDESVTAGGATVTSGGLADVYLARWNGAGALRWLRAGGSVAENDAVALTALGTQVVLTATHGTEPATYGGVSVPGGPAQAAAVVAYNGNGSVAWARALGGTGFLDARAVTADSHHGVVVAGSFSGQLTSGSRSITDNGSTDAFVASFSPLGSPVRLSRISGTGADMVTRADWDEAGNLAATIRITGTIVLGGVAHAPTGPSDQVLAVLSPSLEVLWSTRIAGAEQDQATGLVVAPDGDLVVGGVSDDTVSIAGSTVPLQASDGWVARVEDPTLPSAILRYRSLAPVRVLDSRNGTGGHSTPWGQGETRSVKVTNTLGIPAGAAVVLNLTATQPSAATHLTVSPAGSPPPTASNLNVAAGQTAANLVVAKVSAQGFVDVRNNSGSVHVVADVVGVYQNDLAQSEHAGITPVRLLDSRDGTGGFSTPWPTATPRDVTVAGVPGSGVPANATAVVLNVTITNPSEATHLTVWPAGAQKPTASNLNVAAGETRANLVVAKVGANGKVSIANNSGTAHVVADAVGYFTTSGTDRFSPQSPARILDTRDGTGAIATPFPQATGRPVKVTGVGGVPAGATSVVLNVTAVGPSAATHLTVWPTGQPMPTASNVNVAAGATVPNLVMAKVGAGGQVSIYNNSGATHVVVDVVGWYGA